MKASEIPSLPDQRQTIHNLTLQKHATGLSPPEECILEEQEAQEEYDFSYGPRSSERLLRVYYFMEK